MGDNSTGAIGRREAIKLGAKAAGVTAFAAPVVVGVFNAPSVGAQTGSDTCDSTTDSDAIPAIIDTGSKWNLNCAAEPQLPACDFGRYNGQDRNFTFAGGGGTISIGGAGVGNECADESYYKMTVPEGYICTPYFFLEGCSGTELYSTTATGLPVKWCSNGCQPRGSNAVFLVLDRVECCPVG